MKKTGLTLLALVLFSGLTFLPQAWLAGPQAALASGKDATIDMTDRDYTVHYLEKKLRAMEKELSDLSKEAEKGLNQSASSGAAAWQESLALWNSKEAEFSQNLDTAKNSGIEVWKDSEKDLQKDWKDLVKLYEKAKTDMTGK